MRYLKLFEEFDQEQFTYLVYKYFEEMADSNIEIINGFAFLDMDGSYDRFEIYDMPVGFYESVPDNKNIKLTVPATAISFTMPYSDKSENIYQFTQKVEQQLDMSVGLYDESDDLAPGEKDPESVHISIMCIKNEDMKKLYDSYESY